MKVFLADEEVEMFGKIEGREIVMDDNRYIIVNVVNNGYWVVKK